MPSKPITEWIEVAGVRPATFKLVEKATASYDLFRSSKMIGTARVEDDGSFSARFDAPDGTWSATAEPLKELEAKGRKTADEKLSIAFLQHAQTSRIATLDQQLAAMRKGVKVGQGPVASLQRSQRLARNRVQTDAEHVCSYKRTS